MSSVYCLIYKSKIEKHNISLDIFVSDRSVVYPETFIYSGKSHFSYIKTDTPFFWSDFGVSVVRPSEVDKK